jgi:hypothetical protein
MKDVFILIFVLLQDKKRNVFFNFFAQNNVKKLGSKVNKTKKQFENSNCSIV